MKITVLTDLHLEFGPLALPGGDILLLCGDVFVADYLRPERTDKDAIKHRKVFEEFLYKECARYNRVYVIMGNHEHYHGLFYFNADILRAFFKGTNVTLLDNQIVTLKEGWNLYGATMWTNYNNRDWFAIQAAKDKMNDHQIIHTWNKDRKFTPHHAVEEFDNTVTIMDDVIGAEFETNYIVMTHHAPTAASVNPYFKGDILNYAYHADLENFIIARPNIRYWLHGHMHHNIDYTVGNCRVICNPRGYNGYAINPNFDLNYEIEI